MSLGRDGYNDTFALTFLARLVDVDLLMLLQRGEHTVHLEAEVIATSVPLIWSIEVSLNLFAFLLSRIDRFYALGVWRVSARLIRAIKLTLG